MTAAVGRDLADRKSLRTWCDSGIWRPHVDRWVLLVQNALMLTAGLGLVGVLVGAFLSHGLTASWQRRKERLEALVALVAANARVIGAHERLYDLFLDGNGPGVASEQSQRALVERGEARAALQTAQARAAILIPGNEPLESAMEDFRRARCAAAVWIRRYQQLGPAFSFGEYEEQDREAWLALRAARDDVIAACQAVASLDARWLPVPRKLSGAAGTVGRIFRRTLTKS